MQIICLLIDTHFDHTRQEPAQLVDVHCPDCRLEVRCCGSTQRNLLDRPPSPLLDYMHTCVEDSLTRLNPIGSGRKFFRDRRVQWAIERVVGNTSFVCLLPEFSNPTVHDRLANRRPIGNADQRGVELCARKGIKQACNIRQVSSEV